MSIVFSLYSVLFTSLRDSDLSMFCRGINFSVCLFSHTFHTYKSRSRYNQIPIEMFRAKVHSDWSARCEEATSHLVKSK
jgi:hypothetical protein